MGDEYEFEFDKLLRSLDGVQRQIIELSLDNVSNEKIADTVKRSVRTVRRERTRFEQEIQRRRQIVHDLAESSDSRRS